jgi:hypothetical protein
MGFQAFSRNVEPNIDLMLREAAHDPRRLEEYLDKIEPVDPVRLTEYEQATGIALARAKRSSSPWARAGTNSSPLSLRGADQEAHQICRADERSSPHVQDQQALRLRKMCQSVQLLRFCDEISLPQYKAFPKGQAV